MNCAGISTLSERLQLQGEGLLFFPYTLVSLSTSVWCVHQGTNRKKTLTVPWDSAQHSRHSLPWLIQICPSVWISLVSLCRLAGLQLGFTISLSNNLSYLPLNVSIFCVCLQQASLSCVLFNLFNIL